MLSRRPGFRFNRGRIHVPVGASAAWYPGDDFLVVMDPDRGVTLSGDDVTEAARFEFQAADANWNDQPSLLSDGNDWLVSAAPLANLRFLHDGTGHDVVMLIRSPGSATLRAIVATKFSFGAIGFVACLSAVGTNKPHYQVHNGTANIATDTHANAISVDTKTALRWSYVDAASPEWLHSINAANEETGSDTGVPSASDATALTIGALSTGGSPLVSGDSIALVVIHNARFTAQQWSDLKGYINTRFDMSLP